MTLFLKKVIRKINFYLKRCFSITKEQEWSIGIYRGNTPFDIAPVNSNPVLTKENVTDKKATYVADPFMIKVKDLWYMFFEVKEKDSYQTYIAYATSEDCLKWKYEKIILNGEPIQSYPYIFEWQGEYYMLPESYRTNSIRLYKANNFPEEWHLEKILIKGKEYADSSIVRYNNKWWIFTSIGNKEMYVFYSDTLTGDWKEHSLNPIIKNDKTKARAAGRIIEYNGNLYRFAQDCKEYYGNKVRAFKLLKLTETEYEEEDTGVVLEEGNLGWNSRGIHTIDPHQLEDGTWISCVDGYKEAIT